MDAVEDIKGRLSIEDVISRYVELKRAGRNFKGLSPFSNEKTPSLMVSPEKQIWHDFSSGKGGNMFSFVMEMDGVDFRGALELLARQAGVDLDQYRGSQTGRGKAKERLMEALELAAKFYQVQFKQNKTAQEYVIKKRGFNKETLLAFRLGYSPEEGTKLTQFLLNKGFTPSEIKQAGLSAQRARGPSDMFRGRIMIPLMDTFGRVIGFTARILKDDPNAPKYINTPSTPVYDKSRHVFGLHLAKDAIRKAGYSVVAEGNLDVVASHQAGVRQVVATAGTAMTQMQLKVLQRFAPDVRLAFDQDRAGLEATERAIPIATKAGVSLSIINIPSGKDPDELIKHDPKLWEQAITKHTYAPDWLIGQYQNTLDLSSASGKRQFTDVLLKTINQLDDSVEQDHYLQKIAELTGVSPDAVRQKSRSVSSNTPKRPLQQKTSVKEAEPQNRESVKTQNHLLSIFLVRPDMRAGLAKLPAVMWTETEPQKIAVFLQKNPTFNLKTDTKSLAAGSGDFAKEMLLLYEELYQGLEDLELRYEAARLQVRLIEQYVKAQKSRLAEAMRADDAKTQELLKQAKEFDILLKETKEAMHA